jgi:biopolymer transport protein ExbD
MRFTTRQRARTLEFELTPMIDVVLQLIIFFMVTSQVSRLVRSEVDLPPEPGVAERAEQEGLFIIDVTADGLIIAESRVITRDRFLGMVRAEIARVNDDPGAVRLLVRADRNAPTRAVNQIARDLADLGIRGWRIGTITPLGSESDAAPAPAEGGA